MWRRWSDEAIENTFSSLRSRSENNYIMTDWMTLTCGPMGHRLRDFKKTKPEPNCSKNISVKIGPVCACPRPSNIVTWSSMNSLFCRFHWRCFICVQFISPSANLSLLLITVFPVHRDESQQVQALGGGFLLFFHDRPWWSQKLILDNQVTHQPDSCKAWLPLIGPIHQKTITASSMLLPEPVLSQIWADSFKDPVSFPLMWSSVGTVL